MSLETKISRRERPRWLAKEYVRWSEFLVDFRFRIRVLVVEDNPMIQAGLRYFIQANPQLHLVALAPSGEKAIEFCEQSESDVDVIVMDMNLPGIDGVATTDAIK